MKTKCEKCEDSEKLVLTPIKIGMLVSYYKVRCELCGHEFEIQVSE